MSLQHQSLLRPSSSNIRWEKAAQNSPLYLLRINFNRWTKHVITSAIGFSIVNCCSRSESVTGWVNEVGERGREGGGGGDREGA